jgi:mediator of RNA polymerase II transcription subunit 7
MTILRSILRTYSTLTTSLLAPPPTVTSTTAPDWEQHVEWITVLAQNIMAAANDLRPVQARGNLELMMKQQLALRKEETKTLHAKCDALESRLSELRASTQKLTKERDLVPSPKDLQGTDANQVSIGEDVLCWADGV